MKKYKQILLLLIFGMANFCYANGALGVEEDFVAADLNDDEIAVMLQTLEREKEELGKLKSEFKGAYKTAKGMTEVQMEEEVEKKKKVVLANFVKKSVKKRRKSVNKQNGISNYKEDEEVKKVVTLGNDGEFVEESEKVVVNDEEEEIIHPFEIAENLYKLGEYQTALDIYRLIIKNDVSKEKEMWISYQMANCYRMLSLYDEAVEVYSEMQEVYEGTYWAKQAKWHIQDIEWRAEVEKELERVIER